MVGLPHHCHKVARENVGHALAHRNDTPHSRVPHGHGLAKLVERRLHGGYDSVRRKLFEYLLHLIRALERLGYEILAAERRKRTLCARRNHRVKSLNDQKPLLGRRRRHVYLPHAAVIDHEVKLLHWTTFLSSLPAKRSSESTASSPRRTTRAAFCSAPNSGAWRHVCTPSQRA